jgi:hypothetical protein
MVSKLESANDDSSILTISEPRSKVTDIQKNKMDWSNQQISELK